ncbi:MAG: hypothetical protein U0168_02390 [Nannocystaceae bacterium]
MPPSTLDEPSLGFVVVEGGAVELELVGPRDVDVPEVFALDVDTSPVDAALPEGSMVGPQASRDPPIARRAGHRIRRLGRPRTPDGMVDASIPVARAGWSSPARSLRLRVVHQRGREVRRGYSWRWVVEGAPEL